MEQRGKRAGVRKREELLGGSDNNGRVLVKGLLVPGQ